MGTALEMRLSPFFGFKHYVLHNVYYHSIAGVPKKAVEIQSAAHMFLLRKL